MPMHSSKKIVMLNDADKSNHIYSFHCFLPQNMFHPTPIYK